jgi:hypothetical protein
MKRMLAAMLLAGLLPLQAQAADLEKPDAFEHGFAVSLFVFDGCGDVVTGRMFRRALAEKFAQCPFTPAARTRFQQRTRAQQAKVRRTLSQMIETTGGLPVKLEGMSMTCHEQQAGDDYHRLRAQLDSYSEGKLAADAIISAPCDAPDISP